MIHKVENFFSDIKDGFFRYSYLMALLVGLIVFVLFKWLYSGIVDYASIANVSSVLAGFLFTAMGIFFALPDNKFMNHLRKYGHMIRILRTLFIGAISLLFSAVLSLFQIFESVVLCAFFVGIAETVLSAYFLYAVSYYSDKSA